MEEMHSFYYANTLINFLDIYCWTLFLFTTRLLFKHLLWWAIFCANISLQEVLLRPYYNLCWMQSRPWAKMGFSHFTDRLWAIFQTINTAFCTTYDSGPCSPMILNSKTQCWFRVQSDVKLTWKMLKWKL